MIKTQKNRRDLEDELRRLFAGYAQLRSRTMLRAINLWHPPTDIYETKDAFVIICELAGIDEKDVSTHIDGDVITICGERHEPKWNGIVAFHNLEINYGPFERNIHIPKRFINGEIKATLIGGFLTIRILTPKAKGMTEIEVE